MTVPAGAIGVRLRVVHVSTVLLAALASALIVSLARWGVDWPAQEFRAWIAGHDGLSVWTFRWYGGSALPGYSVLYPLVTAAFHSGELGAAVVGVVGCAGATWAAVRLAAGLSLQRQVVFGLGVVLSACQDLLLGEVPFLLGSAFAVAAFAAVLSARPWPLTAVLACLASLASPLAGFLLVVIAPAVATMVGWRRVAALAAGLTGSAVALVIGGAGGPFPCPWPTFAGVAGFCAAVIVIGPPGHRALRVFALTYLVFDVVAFLVPNPIGGNVARLAKVIVVPLACYFLSTRGVRSLVSAVLVLLVGVVRPVSGFVSSWESSGLDPTRAAAYYSGLLTYLSKQPTPPGRLEIPFTRGHWETYFVARQYPIARGWERQSDLLYNQVLYHPLSARRYRRWLDDNAVSIVALPRAPIDTGGLAEAALLRHPPSYLIPAWHDANWQVWRVAHPVPLVTGAATLVDEDTSSLTLRFSRPGSAVVRMRASRLWSAQDPGGCVGATRQGWVLVRSTHAGTVEIAARINASLLTGAPLCRP
jgi:hypothetical protein